MNTAGLTAKRDITKKGGKGKLKKRLLQHWQLYVLLLPAIIYLLIFNYSPLYGLVIAFEDYKPYLGYLHSPFVGLDNFMRFFGSNKFMEILPNTLILAFYSLIASFPLPIILALSLNYIPARRFKKIVQNVTYAPYFISVVVLVSMLNIFFSESGGLFNNIRELFGLKKVMFLGDKSFFRHLYVWSGVWQSVGWNSIIYFASLANVDESQHEAAIVDGANILQRIRYVDLPALRPIIVTLFIMNAGKVMSIGFEKAYLMQNPLNTKTSEIISTYVYKMGLLNQQYSYSTAIGLFNAVVNLILLVTVNYISKKLSDTSIW